MSADRPEHPALTKLLVECIDRGCSWLGHGRLAGQLDWALLHGATVEDLRDIRPSWRGHILHLQRCHHLIVSQEVPGFFRIVDAVLPAAAVVASVEDCGDYDDDEDESEDAAADILPGDDPPALPAVADPRFTATASAILALHGAGQLANPLLKASVGMLIRQVSECNHWHNSAHYRSPAAAALIATEGGAIGTPAQYQAFCRRRLRHEHMVPNSVIYRMIVENPAPTFDWLVDLFSRLSKRATILREEDDRLRPHDMPPQFFDPRHAWCNDFAARYREIGLFDQLLPLPPNGGWFE